MHYTLTLCPPLPRTISTDFISPPPKNYKYIQIYCWLSSHAPDRPYNLVSRTLPKLLEHGVCIMVGGLTFFHSHTMVWAPKSHTSYTIEVMVAMVAEMRVWACCYVQYTPPPPPPPPVLYTCSILHWIGHHLCGSRDYEISTTCLALFSAHHTGVCTNSLPAPKRV